MSIKEASTIFFREHRTVFVKLTKFQELKRKHVDHFGNIPHVCVCIKHANMAKLAACPNKDLGVPLIDTSNEFLSAFTCDSKNKSCMTMTCANCNMSARGFNPSIIDRYLPRKMVKCKLHFIFPNNNVVRLYRSKSTAGT